MSTISMQDLTIASLCRIGVTLSSYFWLPMSLLLGVAGAGGAVPGLADGRSGVPGFFIAFLQGIGCSIAMDVALVLGAFGYAVARKGRGAGTFALKLRRRPHA